MEFAHVFRVRDRTGDANITIDSFPGIHIKERIDPTVENVENENAVVGHERVADAIALMCVGVDVRDP